MEPSPTRHAIVLSVAPVGSRADGVPLVLALSSYSGTDETREGGSERRGPSRLALACSPLGLAFSGLFTFHIDTELERRCFHVLTYQTFTLQLYLYSCSHLV